MTTRIIFLGTAGDSAVVSKQLRSSGGIIFQVEEMQFHLDPGPGALNKAKEYGVSLQQNTAVLVSHNHINHCNDLNVVIDAMTHGGIEHRGLVLLSKSILEHSVENYPLLTKYHQNLVEKIIPLEKNHKVGLGTVEIRALPAEHTDPTAVGFKFNCPYLTLGYTGDSMLTAPLVEGLKGSDILILNVPCYEETSNRENLDFKSATNIIMEVQPKLAIITHFGLEMLKADPIQKAREIQRKTGVQTIAAKDGLVISPTNVGHNPLPFRGYR